MLVGAFDPKIEVKVSPSIFSRKFTFSVIGLPPNESLEYWIFGPDGGNVGTGSINSDGKGSNIGLNGANDSVHSETSSRPVYKGKYHFGINRTKDKDSQKRRMSLDIWKQLPGDKKVVGFDVNYDKRTILTVNAEKEVPWGMAINVNGQLWFKNEPFPWCSGTTEMQGRRIEFSGNNIGDTYTLTDPFVKFSTIIKVGNIPRSDCWLQARYEGDPIFFEKSESDTIHYRTVKHKTRLEIEIDDLKLKATKSASDHSGRTYLESDQPFRIKCTLVDNELNVGIKGKLVKLDTDLGPKPIECVTEADGSFSLDNLYAPHVARQYRFDAIIEEDYLYDPCNTRLEIVILEKKISPINMVASENASGLIMPDKPFSNEEKIRRILRSCVGYVNWVDNYFRTAGLEWLKSEINKESVKEIRILIPKESANEDLRAYFKRFKEEMYRCGIKCQMKVLIDPKVKSQIHDRWIFSQEKNYNVPSVDVIKRGQWSEIKETESAIPFDDWWRMGADIIMEWNKILEPKENAKKDQSPVPSNRPYSEQEKKLNDLVFKKLGSISFNREAHFLISLRANNEQYNQISYIQHAENALKKYKNIHDTLLASKKDVEEYNVYSTRLSEIISNFIQTQIEEKYPHLSISDKINLDTPSSYSGPSLIELTYDFAKNKNNSEMIKFENSNFDCSENELFGWVLHRINRISGVMTADVILTSNNQVDTEPQTILSVIMGIKDNEEATRLVDEMTKSSFDLEKNIQYFKHEIRRLSECIDLDLTYEQSSDQL